MLEERVRGLETEVSFLKQRLERMETRDAPQTRAPEAVSRALPGRPVPAPSPRPVAPRPPTVVSAPRRTLPDFEDLLGGRVLAWLGGAALVVGLAFLMAMAVSNGWIGEGARTVIGAVLSAALMGAGIWLHERRGRTDAALAALSAGVAAMFGVAVVASEVYEVIPAPLALMAAIATGVLATWLAVRWESRGIAALGILGAMLAPAFAGAPQDPGAMLVLFTAGSAAVAVLLSQGWRWLSFGVVLVALPQWAFFVIDSASFPEAIVTLVGFGLLGAIAAVGHELGDRPESMSGSSAALLLLNALAVGAVGWFALGELPVGHTGAASWLWALAAAHVIAGLVIARRDDLPHDLSLLLLSVGAVTANLAFAATVDGPGRAIGWAAAGVAFAALTRRRGLPGHDGALASIGLGSHLALGLGQLLISDAPPTLIGDSGTLSIASAATLVVLAAACFGSGRLIGSGRRELRIALDVVGLAVVAYATAVVLDGVPLVLAYGAEAVALAALRRRDGDVVAGYGALANLGLALALGVAIAPPESLAVGLDAPLDAVLGLGGVALCTLLIARMGLPGRSSAWLLGGAGVVALYLASVLVVTPFQPDGAASGAALFELPVRQQGQVLLSALWGLCGLAALVAGLLRDVRALRLAALGLLLAAVGKVFLIDLATLTSVYRVISFMALGLLLLVAAFAWQRVRPRDLPDMREAPAGIR